MGIVALTSKGWNSFDYVVAAANAGQELRFGAMSAKLADLAYMLVKAQGVDFNIVNVQGGKAVMDGLNAGDLDVGRGAGIQANAVKAGDVVNLVFGISTRLAISPDAPTLEELGVLYNADGYLIFTAPAGLPNEARDALASAIADIVSESSSKANDFINKGFGGPVVIMGGELVDLLAADEAASAALLEAVSE